MYNKYHIHQHIYIQSHTYTYMTRCYSQFTSWINSPRLPFRLITCLCTSYIASHISIYRFLEFLILCANAIHEYHVLLLYSFYTCHILSVFRKCNSAQLNFPNMILFVIWQLILKIHMDKLDFLTNSFHVKHFS